MTSVAFERQKLSDGTNNPKYVDLLDEDKPISGQKFACISFVSPESKTTHTLTHYGLENVCVCVCININWCGYY